MTTFKTRSNLVLVPVVVRDGQGRALGNLQQDDFQLFDDNNPQVISHFSVEHAGGAPKGAVGSGGNNDAAQADPPAGATPAVASNYIAYVFDNLRISFSDLAGARKAADKFLASLHERADSANCQRPLLLSFTTAHRERSDD